MTTSDNYPKLYPQGSRVRGCCDRGGAGANGLRVCAAASRRRLSAGPSAPQSAGVSDIYCACELPCSCFSRTQRDIHGRFDEAHFSGYGSQTNHQQQLHGGDTTNLRRSSYFKTKAFIQTPPSRPSSSWGGEAPTLQVTRSVSPSAPGDGFAGALGGSDQPQRVPCTPSLQRESQASRHLMTAERRLDFSCELRALSLQLTVCVCVVEAPDEPSGRGHVGLRPITEIRIPHSLSSFSFSPWYICMASLDSLTS